MRTIHVRKAKAFLNVRERESARHPTKSQNPTRQRQHQTSHGMRYIDIDIEMTKHVCNSLKSKLNCLEVMINIQYA
jgi:hypothetical protein